VGRRSGVAAICRSRIKQGAQSSCGRGAHGDAPQLMNNKPISFESTETLQFGAKPLVSTFFQSAGAYCVCVARV